MVPALTDLLSRVDPVALAGAALGLTFVVLVVALREARRRRRAETATAATGGRPAKPAGFNAPPTPGA